MKKTNEEVVLKTPVFTVVKKTFDTAKFQPVGLNCNPWAMVVAVDDDIAKNPVTIFVEQTRWGLENKTIEFPCGTVEIEDFRTAFELLGTNEMTADFLAKAESPELHSIIMSPDFVGQEVYDKACALAAAREFKEETGIACNDEDLFKLAEFNPNPAYFNNRMNIFYLKKSSLLDQFNARGKQALDENEDCRVFTGRFNTYVDSIRKHAMGISALFFLDNADSRLLANAALKKVQAYTAEQTKESLEDNLGNKLSQFRN